MERWMGNTATRSERLFAFICVEGIIFPFLFLVPTFLEELGLMLVFAFANKMIARDEANHCIGGIKLLKREQIKTQELLNSALQLIQDEQQHTRMYQIWNSSSTNEEFVAGLLRNDFPAPEQPELFNVAEDGVAMIDELLVMLDAFVDYFLPEPLSGEYGGFTASGWKNYARLMADQALVACGAKVHYKGINDFPFLDRQGGDKRHNFFERFGIYSHGNVEDLTNWRKKITPPQEERYNPFNDDREI
jgi:ribonucleotide reductase beta subunit family protein with ferritin-like domain